MKTDFAWATDGEVIFNNQIYAISDWQEQNISGGYLFELSNEYDELSKFTTKHGTKVMLKAPEYLYTNDAMMAYVKSYWETYEKAILSEDGYNDQEQHYSELTDLSSMLSYWMTMEVTGNNDSVYKSRYAYKDVDGKLIFGPAWDFDWGVGSYMVGNYPVGWKVTGSSLTADFYKEWTDDPYFCKRLRDSYWDNREYFESMVSENGLINGYAEYLDVMNYKIEL